MGRAQRTPSRLDAPPVTWLASMPAAFIVLAVLATA
jgi:hypothetical protein